MASQQDNTALALLRLVQAINTVNAHGGPLSSLTTADKTSLVAALNEVKAAIPTIASFINDAATASGSTWSSQKIQTQITNAIQGILNGADSASDSLKELADKILALAQADAGLVSTAAVQSFSAAQQKQACENLNLGDPAYNFVPAIESALAAGL